MHTQMLLPNKYERVCTKKPCQVEENTPKLPPRSPSILPQGRTVLSPTPAFTPESSNHHFLLPTAHPSLPTSTRDCAIGNNDSSAALMLPGTPLPLQSGSSNIFSTTSPMNNSDCSTMVTSPLMQGVPLVHSGSLDSVPSTSKPYILRLQEDRTQLFPNLGVSQEDPSLPIHATEPVTNHGRGWNSLASSYNLMGQTNPQTWTTESPQMLPSSNEPAISTNTSSPHAGQYCPPYDMGYLPQIEEPLNGMVNGASHH